MNPRTPLRIGFDMDGVLADFAGAFHEVERGLFDVPAAMRAGEPEEEEANQAGRAGQASPDQSDTLRENRRRRDAIWQVIQSTPDFWTKLRPIQPGAVSRIHEQMLRHGWEVFFITQRPATEGQTVQRQTQLWLVEQGFEMPSVLVIGGSRGAAAGALRLNYHVDDSAQNCLDVIADGRAKPILILAADDAVTGRKARKLGIGVAPAIGEALDILEQVSAARGKPGMLQKMATMIGWK